MSLATETERLIARYVNDIRKKGNTPPLAFNPQLYRAAKEWSKIQAGKGRIWHGDYVSRAKKFGYKSSYVGENVAVVPLCKNPKRLAKRVIKVWVNSPAHVENILRVEYTESGVAVWIKGNKVYVTQDFGRRDLSIIENITGIIRRWR